MSDKQEPENNLKMIKEVELKDVGPVHCAKCNIYFTALTFSQQLLDAAEHFETIHKMSVQRHWKNSQELESITLTNCNSKII
ncbi:MAG: hypothetical protein HRO68_07605 [Nitrosopumilus sp.]|nr:hypothetical protein [Nitrosopumilus sp.]